MNWARTLNVVLWKINETLKITCNSINTWMCSGVHYSKHFAKSFISQLLPGRRRRRRRVLNSRNQNTPRLCVVEHGEYFAFSIISVKQLRWKVTQRFVLHDSCKYTRWDKKTLNLHSIRDAIDMKIGITFVFFFRIDEKLFFERDTNYTLVTCKNWMRNERKSKIWSSYKNRI